jgi:hypothetical protein
MLDLVINELVCLALMGAYVFGLVDYFRSGVLLVGR